MNCESECEPARNWCLACLEDHPEDCVLQEEILEQDMSDTELPGMWSRSDFTGGQYDD